MNVHLKRRIHRWRVTYSPAKAWWRRNRDFIIALPGLTVIGFALLYIGVTGGLH